MIAEMLELSAIAAVIISVLVGLLKKIPSFKGSWCPNVAVIIGAILAIIADAMGLLIPDPSFQEAITIGCAWGAAAIGGHNLAKRIPKDVPKEDTE